MKIELDALTLSEIVQLQTRLSEALKRRFERRRALAFTDVVDSTGHAARFGNQALRAFNQRHLELLEQATAATRGRIVDVAGDGAFTCFASAEDAARAMVALQRGVHDQNRSHEPEHALALRAGVHWGLVLTDDQVVTGREVNLCARVAASAAPAEIRVTLAAFQELPSSMRVGCASLPAEPLKGFTETVSLVKIPWQEPPKPRPSVVRLQETAELFALPEQETISFGRMHGRSGATANDIVLELPDPSKTAQISRWHFELRRRDERWFVRSLTGNFTDVDGRALANGDEAPIQVGSLVRVGEVATLEFIQPAREAGTSSEADETVVSRPTRAPR